jgi:hypothetical protein
MVPRSGVVPAEGIMPIYRAYLLDKENRIKSFEAVEADSDDKALAAAKQ